MSHPPFQQRSPAFAPWLRALCLAACVLQTALPARAVDDPTALERRVKAAYLYKFAGYVEWPPAVLSNPELPFVVAVIGDDELATEVEHVCIDRTIHGHRIVVRRLDAPDSIEGAQIAFVGRAQSEHLERILATAPSAPCLIVTEVDGGLKRGSIVNFVFVEARVRFEISQAAAETRGLNLSSRLLGVAVNVVPAGR